MLLIVIFLTLLVAIISGITTIPFSVGLLAVSTIIFKKSWMFFWALGLGLFLDLISIRPLGYTSLVLTIFVFLIWLYERKFETQTLTFVFISTFLGSATYLTIFGGNYLLLQAFISSLLALLVFRFIKNLNVRPIE